jgi:hypothetical protein
VSEGPWVRETEQNPAFRAALGKTVGALVFPLIAIVLSFAIGAVNCAGDWK